MFSDIVVEHSGRPDPSASPQIQQHQTTPNNVNVCWNEKTTQTEDPSARTTGSSPAPPCAGLETQPTGSALLSPIPSPSSSLIRKSSLKKSPAHSSSSRIGDERIPTSYSAPGPGPGTTSPNNPIAGLTCQELLALSGALGAALPTPLALPAQYVEEIPVSGSSATPTTTNTVGKHNNNNQLAPPGSIILPTLAMALWPEPMYNPGNL